MKIENASIQWLESGLPHSARFDDIYYSAADERGESDHVFLQANNLSQRWQQNSKRAVFQLGEIGFGSGLNFLQTWQLWQQQSSRPRQLNYLAFEKYPLSTADLKRIFQRWPELNSFSDELLASYPDHSGGGHRLRFDNGVCLDLYYGDALSQLQTLNPGKRFDAWYLDGFSPKQNPLLWSQELFEELAQRSLADCTLSTYSVAGTVRRNLSAAGFAVRKVAGYGNKRHMLQGELSELEKNQQRQSNSAPWNILPVPVPTPHHREKTALVIGGGLAGCSTAYSLATRGWQVTLLEQHASLATGASGYRQLALRPRLFKSASPPAQFYCHGFLFTRRQLEQFKRHNPEHVQSWYACGVFQTGTALNKQSPLDDDELESLYAPQMARCVSASEAGNLSGLAINEGGWFFELGGWVEPNLLCQQYIQHPAIELKTNSRITTLCFGDDRWSAIDASGKVLATAKVAIVANSETANLFTQTDSLALIKIRGQSTQIDSSKELSGLKAVLCGERSVFPACTSSNIKGHTLSASYSAAETQTKATLEDKQFLETNSADDICNLEAAATLFSNTPLSNLAVLNSRASLRCNSADGQPIVGPAPNRVAVAAVFSSLSLNARKTFAPSEEELRSLHHPGLYLNIAHGSNGLASCPLSSEYLASLISDENLPVNSDMSEMLNPVRFQIRALKKQKE